MALRMTHVTALVLRALADGHNHGFDVMGVTGMASGTIYPVLRRLERAALVRSRWEAASAALESGRPRRRLYVLTREGERAAVQAEERLAEARRFLNAGLTEPGR